MEVRGIGEDSYLVVVGVFEPEQGHESIEFALDRGAFRTPGGECET